MHDAKTGVDRAWPAYLMRRGPFCRTYPKLGGKFDSAPKKAPPTDEMRIYNILGSLFDSNSNYQQRKKNKNIMQRHHNFKITYISK